MNLIQQLSLAVVVVLAAQAVINLSISQGVMAAVILLTNRFFAPYQQAMRTLSRWHLNKAQIEHIIEVLELNNHVQDSPHSPLVRTLFISQQDKDDLILEQGNIYQFSGASGTGKTQLIRCLLNQQSDKNTHIFIDEISLADYDYLEWQKQCICIDKSTSFVEGSIIDNLTCFQPSLNNAAFALCESLGIKQHIDSLRSGFYTNISSQNQQPFSRKMRFTLCIIRALLSDCKLLIIDDFDTVFDDKYAQQLLACLRPKSSSMICIIVSNRLSKFNQGLTNIRFSHRKTQEAKAQAVAEETS